VKLPFTLVLLLPALAGWAQTMLTNDGVTLTVTGSIKFLQHHPLSKTPPRAMLGGVFDI